MRFLIPRNDKLLKKQPPSLLSFPLNKLTVSQLSKHFFVGGNGYCPRTNKYDLFDIVLVDKDGLPVQIRQQAKAAREARMAKQRELAEERKKVEEKIQELEAKKDGLEKEINRLSRDAEVDAVLSNIGNLLCPHFVPGTKRVMSYDEQKREIKKWIES